MKTKTLLRTIAPLTLAALFLIGATCDKAPGIAPISSPLAKVTITDVSVPAPNQIKITADGPMSGSPVTLEDPLRIGVDVKNAAVAGSPPLPLAGGLIERVEVISGKSGIKGVRVLAYLTGDATYDINNQGNEIILTLNPTGGAGATSAAEDQNKEVYDATMNELDRLLTGAPPQPFEPGAPSSGTDYYAQYSSGPSITPMPPPNGDGSASVIGDIFYRTIRNGIQIMIYTNGDAGNFIDYETQRPPRITVELPGVSSQTPLRSYRVNWAGVSRVRVNNNRDNYNATVSVDLAHSLPAYDINKTSSGIVITVFEEDYARGGLRHTTHVTAQGETLRQIAQQYYGNGDAWPRIYSANREAFTRREDKDIKLYSGDVPLGAGISLYIPGR